MVSTRDIILRLKAVRDERELSYGDIKELMKKNNDTLAKSTISKVFKQGSEDEDFDYEWTLRPLARALLDIENIEDDDNMDVQAMKSLLKYKIDRIEELEQQVEDLNSLIDRQKIQFHEKIDEERDRFNRSIDFLKAQIDFKDKRIDMLLDMLIAKDAKYDDLLDQVISCPYRKTLNTPVIKEEKQ